MRPKVASAADIESGWDGVSNKSVREAFALDLWSLTFRDKALEEEYMNIHSKLMRSPSHIYAIPLFTSVVALMVTVSVLIPQDPGGTFYWAMMSGVLITPLSFTGVVIQKKFDGRRFQDFLLFMQVTCARRTSSV
jgi:hypothetical protein